MNKKQLKDLGTKELVDLVCSAAEELESRLDEDKGRARSSGGNPEPVDKKPRDPWAGAEGLFSNQGL